MEDNRKLEDNRRFTLRKINLILICVSFLVIAAGFVLMSGTPTVVEFNADIFSARRITAGPMISFAGFLFMVFAILYKPKKTEQ